MISMIFPIAFLIVGAGVYIVATNPKMAELGRVLFMAGAFALAFALSGKTWSL